MSLEHCFEVWSMCDHSFKIRNASLTNLFLNRRAFFHHFHHQEAKLNVHFVDRGVANAAVNRSTKFDVLPGLIKNIVQKAVTKGSLSRHAKLSKSSDKRVTFVLR
jgi:hypothetical protein